LVFFSTFLLLLLTRCFLLFSLLSLSQIRSSLGTLVDIKAVRPQDGYPITALGYHLAKMPVDVRAVAYVLCVAACCLLASGGVALCCGATTWPRSLWM
jgi:hypothetical protein